MNNLKVIFHIDDKERWNMVLSNVKNLLNEVNESEIEIEVLANANAVKNYVENEDESDSIKLMKQLSKKDVRFLACNNSINSLGLDKNELYDFVTIVPAGVLELTVKQSKGYAYIKP